MNLIAISNLTRDTKLENINLSLISEEYYKFTNIFSKKKSDKLLEY
jgi:hypothetical protein